MLGLGSGFMAFDVGPGMPELRHKAAQVFQSTLVPRIRKVGGGGETEPAKHVATERYVITLESLSSSA